MNPISLDAARLREAEETERVRLAGAQEAENAEDALLNLEIKPFDLNPTTDDVLQQAVIRKVGAGVGKDKRVGDVGGLVDDLMNSVVVGKSDVSRKRPSDERYPPQNPTTMIDEVIVAQNHEDAPSPSGRRKRTRLALVGSQTEVSKSTSHSKLHNSRIHAFATELDLQSVKPVAAPIKMTTAQSGSANLPASHPKIFAGLVFSHVVADKAINLEIALKEYGAVLIKEDDRLRGSHVDYIVTRLWVSFTFESVGTGLISFQTTFHALSQGRW